MGRLGPFGTRSSPTRTRSRAARGWSASPQPVASELRLDGDGAGAWQIDGAPAPVAGCLDVDLDSSSFTNAFPVHRLGLEIGQEAEAPAAYVRALDLAVERLEQRYARTEDGSMGQRYDYVARRFAYTGRLD